MKGHSSSTHKSSPPSSHLTADWSPGAGAVLVTTSGVEEAARARGGEPPALAGPGGRRGRGGGQQLVLGTQ